MASTIAVNAKRLTECVAQIFAGRGVPDADARIIADSLVEADLRGVSSHGVVRVPTYVAGLSSGSIDPRPNVRVVVDLGPRATVDGDNGMGQVASHRAMQLAIARAREHGIGAVAVRGSRHCGAMAYWAIQALPAGCIGFATTNAGLNMAPTGGRDKIIGNNPLAVAVPTNRPWPMVLDMATSVVAGGKLDVAAIRGQKIPLDWATDPEGNPTDDPIVARQGMLLPVGGPKGYGLAVMLDVLAGVLSGGRFGGGLGMGGSSHFFMAIRVDGYLPLDEFRSRMDLLIDQIHQSRRAPGVDRIYVPGEIEYEMSQRRSREGIPLEEPIVRDLERLAADVGAPGPT